MSPSCRARLDAADFAERGERAFRFHDQADELDDAAARFGHARLAHARAKDALQSKLPGQWTCEVGI